MEWLHQFAPEIARGLREGGPVLWALLLWGGYLYYQILDTGAQVRAGADRCRELDCLFARQCRHWQTVDLSCRYLRQDLLAQAGERIRFLQMAVNAAPLLGLLGTVLGILDTFDGLGARSGGAGGISLALSEGISEALLTTEIGLIIAIPSYILVRSLARRLESTARELTCFELQCHRTWQHGSSPTPLANGATARP